MLHRALLLVHVIFRWDTPKYLGENCNDACDLPAHVLTLWCFPTPATSSLVLWTRMEFSPVQSNTNYPELGFLGGAVVKNMSVNAGDARDRGSIPGSGWSPGGGNGNPPQCSCLENPMDRGTWRAVVHGVTKSWTRQQLSPHTPRVSTDSTG